MTPDIARAVELLLAGELVALPTETVYGLGADASNPEAVARIFAAKGRPADHPLIVHLPGAAHLEDWARDIPPLAWELAENFWPGPLTLILKRHPEVHSAVTGGQDTVGVRVPAHPLALELLRAFAEAGGGRLGGAASGRTGIAAPSANRFGRISPTEASHVRAELGDAVAMILDGGRCPVGIESTIVDLSRDDGGMRLLRPGHITPERIAEVTGVWPQTPEGRDVPRVSGSLDGHYAPRTPALLAGEAELPELIARLAGAGKRCALLARTAPDGLLAADAQRRLPEDAEAYARGVYAALRELDALGVDVIVVESVPSDPEWQAVADRLGRSAKGSGGE